MSIDSRHETPMYIDVEGRRLFAILTRPPDPPRGLGVLFVGAGGYMFSTQRNRFPVRLCRELAAKGFPSLRFDYLGTGESSPPPPPVYRLARPFEDQTEAAARAMEDGGISRYVMVGNCFGARSAMAAGSRLEAVVGAVLLVPPVGDMQSGEGSMVSHLGSGLPIRQYAWRGMRQVGRGIFRERLVRKYLRKGLMGVRLAARATGARIRRLFSRRRGEGLWVSSRFIGSLETFAERGVPVLLLYGEEDAHYGHFRRAAASGALADVLARSGGLIEVRALPGEVEGFASVEMQETVRGIVEDWVQRRADQLDGPPGRSSPADADGSRPATGGRPDGAR